MPDPAETNATQIVLAIDIGGSHVKLKLSNAADELRADSGVDFTPKVMMAIIKKLTKGKHMLTVDAVDAAGNPDPTPATVTWKVRKKRKK